MHTLHKTGCLLNNRLCIEGHDFDEVKHLGLIMSNKKYCEFDIKNRISVAKRCMYASNKLLSSKILSHHSKIKMYHTFIDPVLLYVAEKWIMNKDAEEKLIVLKIGSQENSLAPQSRGNWRIREIRTRIMK